MMIKQIVLLVFVLFAVPSIAQNLPAYDSIKAKHPTAKYEREVAAYNLQNVPEGRAIFSGSSTMVHWENLESDLADLHAVARGLSGSEIRQLIFWSEDVIFKHRPSVLYFYIGDNDALAMTFDEFEHCMRVFVDNYFHRLPDSRLVLITVKPSPSRRAQFGFYRSVNGLFGQLAASDKRVAVIDFWDEILAAPQLYFSSDSLHLNDAGYKLLEHKIRTRN